MGTTNLDSIKTRAENTAVHERLFLYSRLTSPDFGERNYFVQRFSGFFVPPLSSNYTFNIQSDDRSKLYFSPNMSSEHTKLIADLTTTISLTKYDS